MLIQYGEYAIQGNVCPWTSNQLPWIDLQEANSIGEKSVVLAPSIVIHHQVPTPDLISDSVFHVLILEDQQVDFIMASGLPVASSAIVWMSGISRSIRPWWHWWGSWHWTLVTLKPTIWWRWRWWGWGTPLVSSWLAAVLALLLCLASFMVWCPMVMPGHLQPFSSSWEPYSSWGLILVEEAKWWWCRQNQARTSGSSGFNASFSDALGNQPLASPRLTALVLIWACLPTQLWLLIAWMLHLTPHPSSVLLKSPSIDQDSLAWSHHYCFC